MRTRLRVTRAVVFVFSSVLWCAPAFSQQPSRMDMDMAHCGKKFRIATHVAPPYVMVDVDKCVAQKCGPEAFGNNGGVVYKLMMEHVLPQLRKYCQENGYPEFVDFEWYLPGLVPDFTSAEKAVEMVCQGQFHDSFLQPLTRISPKCPSATQYKGPSPADAIAKSLGLPLCNGAYIEYGSAGCISSGPDLVVGAVHVTRRYLDMLDFTVPYMAVQQLIVKREKDTSIPTLVQERIDQVFTIFIPFDLVAWMAILGEIIFVMFTFLIVEAAIFIWLCNSCLDVHVNQQVAPGFHGIIDCFYWAFSMAFNPGASGKYPETAGGRIYLVGHAFFFTLIVTMYTGGVGPAIMSADAGDVTGFDMLKSGAVSVAVVGPRWDPTADPPPYRGNYAGTSIPRPDIYVPESVQFKMLQSEMNVNSDASFSIVTGQRMISTDKLGNPFLHTRKQDPCSEKSLNDGITMGIYDMVRCKSIDQKQVPHATLYDAPQVIHELMLRYNNTGKCSLVAKGERFGSSSYGIGFPKNTSLPMIFSRAIERVKFKGQVDKLLKEAHLLNMHNKCSEPDSRDSLAVSLLTGLFLVVFSIIIIALLGSCIARTLNLPSSTLSDKRFRRTQKKDEERNRIAAEKQGKTPSHGRSAKFKPHPHGPEEDDEDLPGERAKRNRAEMLSKMGINVDYQASFIRKKNDLHNRATRLALTELHDTCERFQDEVLAIERNARSARVKALDVISESTASMNTSNRISRTGARSIRASVASVSGSRVNNLDDGITVSNKRSSSVVAGTTSDTRAASQAKGTDAASITLNPELVFADFTASFPKKQN